MNTLLIFTFIISGCLSYLNLINLALANKITVSANQKLLASSKINHKSTTSRELLLAQANSNKLIPCQFIAYVIDKDPLGLNVRSAPNSQTILAKLPTTALTVDVNVVACQGDWVQINKAESTQPDGVPFQGKGWVYAPLLGTGTRGYGSNGVFLYASPSRKSRKLGKAPSNITVSLLSGNGKWVLVQHGKLKGWLAPDDQCPAQLTTCP